MRSLRIVLAGGLLLAAASGAAQGTWVQKASISGVGRFWAASFSAGGKGYAGTGRTGFSGNAVADFWEYDPATDTWAQIADYPGGAREGASAFSTDAKGYVGFGTSFINFEKDFYEYDPAANAWTALAACPGIGFAYSEGFVIDSTIYIGPENGTGNVYAYQIGTNTWSEKANFPGRDRRAQVAFSVDGTGYLGLGFWVFGSVQRDMWKYDPVADAWTEISNMDIPSDQSFGFGLNGYGYVYNVGQNAKNLYRYDPAADAWELDNTFPGNRTANASGFTIGDKGYLVFGEETVSGGNTASSKLWEFTPNIFPNAADPDLPGMARLDAAPLPGKLLIREARYTGTASLELRDLSGRLAAERGLPPGGRWEGIWPLPALPAGVYVLRLQDASGAAAAQKLYIR
ncbi:MAG: kelch repeat-containing protein [Bacteroidia bacterium]|nr:kelch repeat-containing protein [Bacteroidia bacterium]